MLEQDAVAGGIMLSLIERSIEGLGDQMILLAPPQATVPAAFSNVDVNPARHQHLLREMQRLRGSIYLEEGNVKAHQLTADGRHETPEDDRSWHLLMMDPGGIVRSCALYLDHDMSAAMKTMRVQNCPLASDRTWKTTLKGAVESEIARARQDGLKFAELGGWAIKKERRGTPEGLLMAVGTYGLSRVLGGALGITTANVAHSCSSILRRLGGSLLEFEGTTIPAYFDPKYNTYIELLRFDSRTPGTKYARLIDYAKHTFTSGVSIIAQRADALASRPLQPLAPVRAVAAA